MASCPKTADDKSISLGAAEYSAMNPKSTADVLSDLLQVLKSGEEGFRKATEVAKDPGLKAVLTEFARERAEMAEEILRSVPAEAKEVATRASPIQAGFDLKTSLTSGDDFTILAECERSENRAVEVFKRALDQDLPRELCRAITSQSLRILQAHDKLRELRNAAQPTL
jgi:uncharacterized protein (TIGR02284 family)